MLVPGHTPADTVYLIDASVFVGDTLSTPDVGSARADFPRGDVHQRMRRCTGYWRCRPRPPCTSATTTGRPRARRAGRRRSPSRTRTTFTCTTASAKKSSSRCSKPDATLEVPTLILRSIQVNVRAGQLPPAEEHGVSNLRIPLNALPVHR